MSEITFRASAWRARLTALAFVLLATFANAWAASDPQRDLEQASQRMFDALEQQQDQLREEPQRVYAIVDEILVPLVDFQRASQWVLGAHWRSASADQRERFIDEFRTLLVRFYGTALGEFVAAEGVPARGVVRFLPQRGEPDGDQAVVRSEIRPPGGGAPVRIAYRLTQRDGAWKVFDVAVEGVSMVATYRSSFAAEIRQGGMDGLLEALAERNRKLARPG